MNETETETETETDDYVPTDRTDELIRAIQDGAIDPSEVFFEIEADIE